VVSNGTGRGARVLNRPVAGKTGTTNDQMDAWFVGYTPDLLATVWVGYDDRHSLGPNNTGGKIAVPFWTRFMQAAMTDRPVADFEMPDGIRCVMIDPASGLRARAENMRAYLECFREGTEPQEFTPIWRYEAEQVVPAVGDATTATLPPPGSAPGAPLPPPGVAFDPASGAPAAPSIVPSVPADRPIPPSLDSPRAPGGAPLPPGQAPLTDPAAPSAVPSRLPPADVPPAAAPVDGAVRVDRRGELAPVGQIFQ
jgi:penicillin-binding protein 1A